MFLKEILMEPGLKIAINMRRKSYMKYQTSYNPSEGKIIGYYY